MKIHNFYAGPSILSDYTLRHTAEAVVNFADMGLSILEISHRSPQFVAVIEEASQLIKELLAVPEGYSVLWLGSGASMQFCMVPYNLLRTKAAYLHTGTWAGNAINEARLFGEVDVVASSADRDFSYIPTNYTIPANADYFHFTSNNTIYGTQLRHDPQSPVPLVADMSSDIFSRPIDVDKYDLIYAGAQKNIAPAGVALVIVKNSALGHTQRPIPSILNYQKHIERHGMFNTPPVLPIYAALQTLRYYKQLGGVAQLQKQAEAKAAMLYDAIDSSHIFQGTAQVDSRSLMNVRFVMAPGYQHLQEEFINYAATRGIVGIAGHRSVGGFRASIYNAMPIQSVEELANAIAHFDALNHKKN